MKYLRLVLQYMLKGLPHINIILAVVLLTLFVTDRYNGAMGFISNDITKWMLCIFCVSVLAEAISVTYLRRHAERTANQRRETRNDAQDENR